MTLEITPWRKTGTLRPFWTGMENLWNRFFDEMSLVEQSQQWSPSVDVSETDGRIQVRAELPGLEAKDIDVDVTENVLTLRGEKKMEKEKEEEKYYHRESYSGFFQRSFRLPAGVESDKVDAEFKNGILTINIPKSAETKQKKIEIKSA